MPVESGSKGVERQPLGQPPIDPPVQPLGNENPPSISTNNAPNHNEPIAIQLEQQIRSGERWLIGLGIATLLINSIIALIYRGQLTEMNKATKAGAQAAYAACFGSQVARSTLMEYQRNAVDSHLAMVAAYAQAQVAMQSQKTFVDADFTVPSNRNYGKPVFLLLRLKNTGKSDASNIRITGWTIIAKPNSPGSSTQPKKEFLFSIQKDSMRVGEQLIPDSPGTGKDGNPHGMYVSAVNEKGDLFVDTAELDKAVFIEHKMAVFAFYVISYEEFTARYSRKVCTSQYFLGPDAPPLDDADIDKQCNAYNNQTEVPKIPMPPPSKPVPAGGLAEINCPAPPAVMERVFRSKALSRQGKGNPSNACVSSVLLPLPFRYQAKPFSLNTLRPK